MKLYDTIIKETEEQLAGIVPAVSPYDPARCWKDRGESELVMKREAAYELGGSGKPSVNYTCVTTSGLIAKDEVWIYGPDLPEINSDTAFARIALLEVDDIGEDEEAYQAIRQMEYVKYHIFPIGYMIRVSAQSDAEQVRVSAKIHKAGASFRYIGNSYIRKYRALPGVKHVRILFITDEKAVEALGGYAGRVDAITNTLTHILDGLTLDCGHCSMKAVCDEVDGMREAHLSRIKKEKEHASSEG